MEELKRWKRLSDGAMRKIGQEAAAPRGSKHGHVLRLDARSSSLARGRKRDGGSKRGSKKLLGEGEAEDGHRRSKSLNGEAGVVDLDG